jgi:hypothetical protein
MFKDELEFFVAHQDELVEKYEGKILVIKGGELLGVYNDPLQAYIETQKQYELGTFMIQPCQSGPEAYTVTISPVQRSE